MTRNIDFKGQRKRVVYNKTKEGFIIDGTLYSVQYEHNQIICRNGSKELSHFQIFNGVTIPQNDKRIIEMIFEQNDKNK